MANTPPNLHSEPAYNVDFEEIEHTADWALRVRGRDLAELLLNAARGMVSLVVADPAAIPTNVKRQVELASIDPESLLVDWLSELAYWAETEGVIFHQFDLQAVTSTSLQATIHGGQAADLKKHIKAVTYHNLEIVKTENGLETTIVFDV